MNDQGGWRNLILRARAEQPTIHLDLSGGARIAARLELGGVQIFPPGGNTFYLPDQQALELADWLVSHMRVKPVAEK